jgi:tRNA(Ile)-lysidine synthase
MGEVPFERRFADSMRSLGIGPEPRRLLVAFSGGVDSTVLLYLLRFDPLFRNHTITAAHFDHRMRSSSADDAAWVTGLCRAWNVPLTEAVALVPLAGERAAREERYRFLRLTAAEVGAEWILTAHHADDQAETVLFRIVRGTGLSGLRGIPARTASRLLRPLLPFWREEIGGFARERGLRWREDPTNETLGPARNRIRRAILPEIERNVAPRARRSLVRLAALARENEEGWHAVVARVAADVAIQEGNAYIIDRAALREHGPVIGARVVRELLRPLEVVPDRLGTRSALQFITDAPSGRELKLPRGVRIRTEFGQARIERVTIGPPDDSLIINAPGTDSGFTGELSLGGRRYRVIVHRRPLGSEDAPPDGWRIRLPSARDRFPLLLRGRQAGDRIRTFGGTKSLKKLMIEHRVPRSERARVPVLVDSAGVTLWAAGVAEDRDLGSDVGDLVLDVAAHG